MRKPANKVFRCDSFNCNSSRKCGKSVDEANKVAAWVYALVLIAIVGGQYTFA